MQKIQAHERRILEHQQTFGNMNKNMGNNCKVNSTTLFDTLRKTAKAQLAI